MRYDLCNECEHSYTNRFGGPMQCKVTQVKRRRQRDYEDEIPKEKEVNSWQTV